MVERYYDKRSDPHAPNPFRSEGFLRHGAIPRRDGGEVPLGALPPFLRALLVTDGTVTKILSAYFWEPVQVQTLEQEQIRAERPIEWLRVAGGDPVLIRRARLQGGDSARVYATAFSVIRTELIPETFRRRLIAREIGIGVLIRDSGLESYRELLEVGVEPGGDQTDPGTDGRLGTSDQVFRSYRIIIAGEPVILITESFPWTRYV